MASELYKEHLIVSSVETDDDSEQHWRLIVDISHKNGASRFGKTFRPLKQRFPEKQTLEEYGIKIARAFIDAEPFFPK